MNITRFSRHLIACVLSAALLAGCSAGSQFTPPSAGAQQAGIQQAATMHVADAGRNQGVSPGWELPPNMAILWGNRLCFYYVSRTTGIWHLMYCIYIRWPVYAVSGMTASKITETSLSNGDVDVYNGKKLVSTLTGLSSGSTGLVMDSKGDTFASVAGSGTIEEFAAGSSTPTGSFTDTHITNASYLAMDKANHLYVEGTSVTGGIEVDELAGSSFESLAQPGLSTLGTTPGGLAVQTSGKSTYVWINDQGNASSPAHIARYTLTGTRLGSQGSFEYSGINGAITVDPTGKDTTDVYAVNNVASGSGYSVTGIDYTFPSGTIKGQSPAESASAIATGIWTN